MATWNGKIIKTKSNKYGNHLSLCAGDPSEDACSHSIWVIVCVFILASSDINETKRYSGHDSFSLAQSAIESVDHSFYFELRMETQHTHTNNVLLIWSKSVKKKKKIKDNKELENGQGQNMNLIFNHSHCIKCQKASNFFGCCIWPAFSLHTDWSLIDCSELTMTAHANVFFVRVVYESYPVVAFSLSNVTYQKEAVTSHSNRLQFLTIQTKMELRML